MRKWFEPVSDIKKIQNKGELSGSEFYWRFGLQRTGITEEHFLQSIEVGSITAIFAAIFNHGGTLTVSSIAKYIRRSFIIRKNDPPPPKVFLETSWAKIMLAAGLLEDGAAAVVNGEIKCIAKMMFPGKRYTIKALNQLGSEASTHTRHISTMANSIRFRRTINIVTSHRGRCCLFLAGRIIGQISSFNGFGRPVYILPCNMPRLPKPSEELRVKCNDNRINQIISTSKSHNEIYQRGINEIERAERKKRQKEAALNFIRHNRVGAVRDLLNFRQFDKVFQMTDDESYPLGPNTTPRLKTPELSHSIVYRGGVAVYNLINFQKTDVDKNDTSTQYHLSETHYQKGTGKIEKPTRMECIMNAFRKKKKVRSLDEFLK